MALLATQTATVAGIALTLGAAAGAGDTFANTGKEVLIVKNAGASAVTVTVAAINNCDMGTKHDIAVSVAAGAEEVIGPFRIDRYNSATGLAAITYSAVTSVTVGVLKVA